MQFFLKQNFQKNIKTKTKEKQIKMLTQPEQQLKELQEKIKNTKFFTLKGKYDNELELIYKILQVYSLLNFDGKLQDKEMLMLAYYIKLGYSHETKAIIKKSLKIKIGHLDNLNYQLSKKKLLIRDLQNYHLKKLSPELLQIREFFIQNKNRNLLINFK